MKIKWLGHATFLITSESGTRIITDPLAPAKDLHYDELNEAADIVTISHNHFDHCNVDAVSGNPEVVNSTARVKGIEFRGIASYHDDAFGQKRGNNTIFCFDIDGVKVCHLGDLGHILNDRQIAEIGKVDVLLIPVGGFFTIDARTAGKVCEQLQPGMIIPMHFKNEKCDFPISGVDEFLSGKRNINQPDSSEAEFKAGELPAEIQITVLKPAL